MRKILFTLFFIASIILTASIASNIAIKNATSEISESISKIDYINAINRIQLLNSNTEDDYVLDCIFNKILLDDWLVVNNYELIHEAQNNTPSYINNKQKLIERLKSNIKKYC